MQRHPERSCYRGSDGNAVEGPRECRFQQLRFREFSLGTYVRMPFGLPGSRCVQRILRLRGCRAVRGTPMLRMTNVFQIHALKPAASTLLAISAAVAFLLLFVRLLQIFPRLFQRALRIVAGLQGLPILVGGALPLPGKIENFS